MIKTILVPVDGSAHADTAVDWASDLAAKYQARLIILHVIPEGRLMGARGDLRELAKVEKMTEAEAVETLAADVVRTAAGRARARAGARRNCRRSAQ